MDSAHCSRSVATARQNANADTADRVLGATGKVGDSSSESPFNRAA
jgi:hypothetical protein